MTDSVASRASLAVALAKTLAESLNDKALANRLARIADNPRFDTPTVRAAYLREAAKRLDAPVRAADDGIEARVLDGRLTILHVAEGRDRSGVEWTLCGMRVPANANSAPADAPVCSACEAKDH